MSDNAPNEVQSLSQLASAPTQTIYSYNVPPGMDPEIRQVALGLLSPRDENAAIDRARGSPGKGITESTIQALRQINGKRVMVGGEGESNATYWFNRMHPKLRNALEQRYLKLHTASAEDQDSFLESEQAIVAS